MNFIILTANKIKKSKTVNQVFFYTRLKFEFMVKMTVIMKNDRFFVLLFYEIVCFMKLENRIQAHSYVVLDYFTFLQKLN